jgi:hypothetical protein
LKKQYGKIIIIIVIYVLGWLARKTRKLFGVVYVKKISIVKRGVRTGNIW